MDRNNFFQKTVILKDRIAKIPKLLCSCAPLVHAIEYMCRFGISFLLSRAVIFGTYAPFGAAFCAACSTGFSSVLGLIGAVCGYLSIIYRANGLKYTAICILIFTAGFVFRDTSLYKKRWFMPLAATLSCAVIGIIFVADSHFAVRELAFYIAEVLIVAVCSYLYQFSFVRQDKFNTLSRTSIILMLATLVIPLIGIKLWNLISIGIASSMLIVMLAGYYGGVGIGSAFGIVLALAACAGGGEVYLCAVLGFCGLFPAIFRKKGRLIFTLVYILSNVVGMLWITMKIDLAMLYEAFFASVIFLPTCEMFGAQIRELFICDVVSHDGYDTRLRHFLRARLESASVAFKQLAHTVESAFHSEKRNNSNITNIFNSSINNVCKKCVLASNCWEREYITTREALNDATVSMRSHGRLSAEHFPNHFSSRCIHIDDFINSANNEYTRFLYREQCASRIEESRNMVKQQYRELSDVLEEFAEEISFDPLFDEQAEIKLCALLARENVRATPWVYRDSANHLRIQIEGVDLSALTSNPDELQSHVSEILGTALTRPRINRLKDSTCIIMRQREPMYATIGVAVHKKQGGEISGDSGSYFRTEDGKLCVILADGMGSGKSAATLSAQTISLLERFLQSGIAPKLALRMINSALMLKSERDAGFTTIDFLRLDLYTGNATFYKLGSAPSYIKHGRSIKRLCGSKLPAGVPSVKSDADVLNQRLQFGDFIIFATDGIADKNDDEWLITLISEFEGTGAKQLAAEIMAGACAKYGYSDDMSVLVVRLDKNT